MFLFSRAEVANGRSAAALSALVVFEFDVPRRSAGSRALWLGLVRSGSATRGATQYAELCGLTERPVKRDRSLSQ
jgi:hypothetical protein